MKQKNSPHQKNKYTNEDLIELAGRIRVYSISGEGIHLDYTYNTDSDIYDENDDPIEPDMTAPANQIQIEMEIYPGSGYWEFKQHPSLAISDWNLWESWSQSRFGQKVDYESATLADVLSDLTKIPRIRPEDIWNAPDGQYLVLA